MCLGIFELWTIIFTHSGDEVVTPWENPTIAMVSTQLHDKKSYKKRKQWKEIQDVSTTTIVTIVPSGNDGAEISPAGDERRTEEVSTSCSATERGPANVSNISFSVPPGYEQDTEPPTSSIRANMIDRILRHMDMPSYATTQQPLADVPLVPSGDAYLSQNVADTIDPSRTEEHLIIQNIHMLLLNCRQINTFKHVRLNVYGGRLHDKKKSASKKR
ncbi:hypothetical protein QR680_008648 [Steinernema hermaphroditum]|uniref:Uncharacterized protein n=1 Tax=Steinernema hermaphroditum TaxID=289476 RepID=A0AA39M7D5_9BILA|nr:hypothetical protein QR680_008648 [Steinernema hermaphroditum]